MEQGDVCICCIQTLDQNTGILRLEECKHLICNECYWMWRWFKDNCPICWRPIISYTSISQNPSSPILIDELIKSDEENPDDFQSFDHDYFSKEFVKLKNLVEETLKDRFKSKGAKGTNFEF